MNKYTHYITTKYNDSFEKVDGLQWLPWVGKHYDETRILIIGASTHKDDGHDWTLDPQWGGPENASHILVAGVENKDAPAFGSEFSKKPFDATVKMFLPEMDMEQARQQFWPAVAFNNFCQEIVEESGDPCPCREESIQVLQDTIEILKPRLVIAWTTEIGNFGFDGYEDQEKINRDIPKVVDKPTPIVGIKHPSMAFSAVDWLEFLQRNPVTSRPIADLMAYLKR